MRTRIPVFLAGFGSALALLAVLALALGTFETSLAGGIALIATAVAIRVSGHCSGCPHNPHRRMTDG